MQHGGSVTGDPATCASTTNRNVRYSPKSGHCQVAVSAPIRRVQVAWPIRHKSFRWHSCRPTHCCSTVKGNME